MYILVFVNLCNLLNVKSFDMTWYLILLAISVCILIVQTILSFVGGEIDFDTDLDSSDILSFKGIIHFIFGFSLTLTVMKEVSLLSTFIAVLVGMLFTVILFYLYKYIYKYLRQEMVYQNEIKDSSARIYYWNSELNKGQVVVTLEGRLVFIDAISTKDMKYKPGDTVKVEGTRNQVTIK